jgi:hypothetical protein
LYEINIKSNLDLTVFCTRTGVKNVYHVLSSPRKTPLLSDHLITPFDSVENAHQYVRLLAEAMVEAKGEIAADLSAAERGKQERRVQALQIVQFKLEKLEQHLQTSSRLLNDLRTLRRLLLEERAEPAPAGQNFVA